MQRFDSGPLIINLLDGGDIIFVYGYERDMALEIALAFKRGVDMVCIMYSANLDSVWRMLSFLECVYDLKNVNIHRSSDGMTITKIGD